MTFREANNMIDDISWFYGGESITTDDIVECREICHKALEKQIPKKPILKETKCFDGSTDDFIFICPVCNRNICIAPEDDEIASYIKEEYPHCNCGQALDWSDTE